VAAALAGRISNREGAAALRLSPRQFQRLKQRFREGGGAPALRHQGRGRLSHRRLPASTTVPVQALLSGRYKGFNDTHATEKLLEVEKIAISRESVRRLRRALDLPAVHRRRPAQHRSRRPREQAAGQLVQLDGSPFDWLEGRGPTMTLLGAIDDATSQVVALHFRPTEDLHGYATVLQQMFTTVGLPVALYGDGVNILVRNDRHWTLDEQLAGTQAPTHLGRVLQDLGIGYVQARSPQGKGRVERLWGTLPDRLVSELRLRGIATRAAANAFLPEFIADFNRRFAQAPAAPQSVWRRPPRDGRLVVRADEAVIATIASPGPAFALSSRHAPGADRRRSRARPPSLRTALNHLATAVRRPPAARHPWRRAYDPRLAERAGYPQHQG
jgi:transposase